MTLNFFVGQEAFHTVCKGPALKAVFLGSLEDHPNLSETKQLGFFIPTLFIDGLTQKVLILRYLRGFFELPPCTAEGDNLTEHYRWYDGQ